MKCREARAPLVSLGCMVPNRCQNLSSKGGKSELNIPRVVGGIAIRSNMRDQPGGLSLLRLLAPSMQFSYNVPPLQDGDVRRLVSHPTYCCMKNLIPRFHWLI